MRVYVNECLPPRCPRCGVLGVYQACNLPEREQWCCGACDTTYTGLADDEEFPFEVANAIKNSKLSIETIARWSSLSVSEVLEVRDSRERNVLDVQLVALALLRLPYAAPAAKTR